ncbi:MAG: hypothetical protein QOE92_593 [Chloroflexota bacterium]|jgi:hypothetical protein|nr:hypothetical protein [Chloroflexota bacterium]
MRIGWAVVALAAAMLPGCGSSTATTSTPQSSPSICADRTPATPPQAVDQYCGRSIENLTEAWWQWAVAEPTATNPVSDKTGDICGKGQPQDVWFLTGTTEGAAQRKCSIPADRAIFFPVLNEICGSQSTQCSQSDVEGGTTAATIDGVTLAPRSSTSEPFLVNPVAGNPFVDRPGALSAKSYGLWILLRPLAAGTHVVKFSASKGRVHESAEYNLTVS